MYGRPARCACRAAVHPVCSVLVATILLNSRVCLPGSGGYITLSDGSVVALSAAYNEVFFENFK